MARILVVDDEQALLRLLETYLSRLGHEVVCCPTGFAGVAKSADAGEHFDAAILDHWLPDMSGMDLLSGVRQNRPGLPILVSSGSLMDLETLPLEDASRIALLQKPYLPRQLAESISRLLEG